MGVIIQEVQVSKKLQLPKIPTLQKLHLTEWRNSQSIVTE